MKALSADKGRLNTPKDFYWIEKNIPCQHACPAKTDIPGYLGAIAQNDFKRAYEINLRDNVFPGTLGRICARPCEPPCRHGYEGLGDPVAICHSKRAASDFLHDQPDLSFLSRMPSTKRCIAIIGGGPSGLTLARQLFLLGHSVKIYEQHTALGGMLVQGIPEFRLPRNIVKKEIDQIISLGIEVQLNFKVGEDITLSELIEKNDAVVIAAGTLNPVLPKAARQKSPYILHGLDFLRSLNSGQKLNLPDRLIVVGGGFTAIDCARVAKRCGVQDVKMVYRRTANEMVATPGEIEEMEKEGVSLILLASPKSIHFNGESPESIEFARTYFEEDKVNGQKILKIKEDDTFRLPTNTIIFATGQTFNPQLIDPVTKSSLLDTNGQLLMKDDFATTISKLFVAGDYCTGASTLINAIGNAKLCARSVDQFLMAKNRSEDYIFLENGRNEQITRDLDPISRTEMPVSSIDKRELELEVELGFSQSDAIQEAQRCYLCHYKYEIDTQKCIYCDQCCEVKPRKNCIVKISSLEVDSKDRILGWKTPKNNFEPQNQFFYWINQEDCIRCNACHEVCPVDCISVQKVSLINCN